MALKHVHGRVIVYCDLESKNSHRFEDGTEIRLARGYNNFNRRQSQPVNAVVISSDCIPNGSEILINHNSLHETNKINDYIPLSGAETSTSIRYYSLPIDDCYAWWDENGELKPMKNFEFGLRVFKPYKGAIQGIEPELIKDVLYVTTGNLKGKVVNTLKAVDYEIVFQNRNGVEGNVIRFRHSDTENLEKEELIGINEELTKKVLNGDLFVGIEIKDAKSIKNG